MSTDERLALQVLEESIKVIDYFLGVGADALDSFFRGG